MHDIMVCSCACLRCRSRVLAKELYHCSLLTTDVVWNTRLPCTRGLRGSRRRLPERCRQLEHWYHDVVYVSVSKFRRKFFSDIYPRLTGIHLYNQEHLENRLLDLDRWGVSKHGKQMMFSAARGDLYVVLMWDGPQQGKTFFASSFNTNHLYG